MLPNFLQSALWSYDLKKMDPKNKYDKKVIIQQILNYGAWEQLQWLLKTYSWREIKAVVKNPNRGMWNEQSLNYWLKFYKIKLSVSTYNKAIIHMIPNFEYAFASHRSKKKKIIA